LRQISSVPSVDAVGDDDLEVVEGLRPQRLQRGVDPRLPL
jgi:hypothetical protein